VPWLRRSVAGLYRGGPAPPQASRRACEVHCAQSRQRSLLLSWPEEADKAWEPSVSDISVQWTETYLNRMDFTGLILLPCPVLRAVIMRLCTTGWSVSGLPLWVLVLPAVPLPHTL